MIRYLVLFLGFCGAIASSGPERREAPVSLKTSVIVPCHHRHFWLLDGLLQAYASGSVVPDEVVISLSEYLRVDKEALRALEEGPWPFELVVVKQKACCSPGTNRNAACEKSSGDLLICQDADDLPHPKRVEILKRLFEKYKLEILIHQWLPSEERFGDLDVESVIPLCEACRHYGAITFDYLHNGSVALRREVTEQVRWRNAFLIHEDVSFNHQAFAMFKYKGALPVPLIHYRGEFSTFRLDENRVID